MPDRGRVVLPGKRLGWEDRLGVAALVVAALFLARTVESWWYLLLVPAYLAPSLTETLLARLVITDDDLVDDQRLRRITVPLAAVRWARARDGRVDVGVEMDQPIAPGGPTTRVVTLGPWASRVTGGHPAEYADAIAATIWARVGRLEAGTARDVKRRSTRLSWAFFGVVSLAFVVWVVRIATA